MPNSTSSYEPHRSRPRESSITASRVSNPYSDAPPPYSSQPAHSRSRPPMRSMSPSPIRTASETLVPPSHRSSSRSSSRSVSPRRRSGHNIAKTGVVIGLVLALAGALHIYQKRVNKRNRSQGRDWQGGYGYRYAYNDGSNTRGGGGGRRWGDSKEDYWRRDEDQKSRQRRHRPDLDGYHDVPHFDGFDEVHSVRGSVRSSRTGNGSYRDARRKSSRRRRDDDRMLAIEAPRSGLQSG